MHSMTVRGQRATLLPQHLLLLCDAYGQGVKCLITTFGSHLYCCRQVQMRLIVDSEYAARAGGGDVSVAIDWSHKVKLPKRKRPYLRTNQSLKDHGRETPPTWPSNEEENSKIQAVAVWNITSRGVQHYHILNPCLSRTLRDRSIRPTCGSKEFANPS
ncbi:hypothetical protein EV401DRAFT_15051 [Pisolithus croceorrhizus]|nr:hypothetical protein EV401DRAFT_15051 [Pisolithus croceorrhizus]